MASVRRPLVDVFMGVLPGIGLLRQAPERAIGADRMAGKWASTPEIQCDSPEGICTQHLHGSVERAGRIEHLV